MGVDGGADGKGWILTFDPSRRSFKAALIHIIFSACWLEAKLHLEIASRFSKTKADQFDKKRYEDKLELLGVLDEELRGRFTSFRDLRRELAHEKAFFNQGSVLVAQKEARQVRMLMQEVSRRLAA